MIPLTFGSRGTPQILRHQTPLKIYRKQWVCGLPPKQHSQEPHQSLGLYEHTHKQNRPTDQKYNKIYYVLDEQCLKLTAHDMRSALVDEKLDKQSPYTTHTSTSPRPHFCSHSSPAPMRSPMNLELASFKKSIKREASAYSA